MMIKTFLTALAGGAASLSLVAGSASAEWTELGSSSGTTIYTQDGDGAVIMGCDASGGLALGFLLEDADVGAAVSNPSERWKLRRGSIYVAGEEVFNNKFVYKPAAKLAETNSPRALVQVYNASIRGDELEFDLGRHGSVAIALPSANAAFETFAADCIDSNLGD